MAVFWLTGRTLSLSDALHMAQMKGSSMSTNSNRMLVGSGISEHVFGGDMSRSLRISSSVNFRNSVSCFPWYGVNDGGSAWSVSARTALILSTKKTVLWVAQHRFWLDRTTVNVSGCLSLGIRWVRVWLCITFFDLELPLNVLEQTLKVTMALHIKPRSPRSHRFQRTVYACVD